MTEKVLSVATLNDHTAQEVFDHVAKHLLTQRVASKEHVNDEGHEFGCAYRGHSGRMCAAGCLISETEYRRAIEGSVWADAIKLMEFDEATISHTKLIHCLQAVHDAFLPHKWKERLTYVATAYSLSDAVIHEYDDIVEVPSE